MERKGKERGRKKGKNGRRCNRNVYNHHVILSQSCCGRDTQRHPLTFPGQPSSPPHAHIVWLLITSLCRRRRSERVQGTGIAGGSVERGGNERKTKECAWRKKRNPRGCDYFSPITPSTFSSPFHRRHQGKIVGRRGGGGTGRAPMC